MKITLFIHGAVIGMQTIKKILNNKEKSIVTNDILRQLPEWFGIEEAIVNYVNEVPGTDFYAACYLDQPIGFISIKSNNLYTSEIYVMGILKEFQNQRIGKQLLACAQKSLLNQNVKYLMVKTLGESHPDIHYKRTREFYCKTGFLPLEEIKEIWGEDNPCLIMVKNI